MAEIRGKLSSDMIKVAYHIFTNLEQQSYKIITCRRSVATRPRV